MDFSALFLWSKLRVGELPPLPHYAQPKSAYGLQKVRLITFVYLYTNYCLWTELYSELIPNGGLALAILVL